MKFLLYGAVPEAAFTALEGLAAAGGRWDVLDGRATGPVAGTVRDVVAVVREALPGLRAAVGDWDAWGRLVVDGLLLDLELGRRLRESGVTAVEPDWLVLVLPDGAAAYGMRCVRAGDGGAGLMWRAGDTARPPLPAEDDIAGLADPDGLPAGRRLALRHLGWLSGSRSTALHVAAGSALHRELSAAGERLHEIVRSATSASGGDAIAVVRQVIDGASALLDDVLPAGGGRRVTWSGAGW